MDEDRLAVRSNFATQLETCCPECCGELVELPHGSYSVLECARGCGWWDETRPVKKSDDEDSRGDRLGAAIKWAAVEWSESRAPRCEICGELEPHKLKWGGRKALALDHCHKTNRQRGRLCARCNTGLGFFRDDPRLLLSAMEYLRKYCALSRATMTGSSTGSFNR
jgi:Recombination endonuclease VII